MKAALSAAIALALALGVAVAVICLPRDGAAVLLLKPTRASPAMHSQDSVTLQAVETELAAEKTKEALEHAKVRRLRQQRRALEEEEMAREQKSALRHEVKVEKLREKLAHDKTATLAAKSEQEFDAAHGISHAQSLRWREFPKGGGATRFAQNIKGTAGDRKSSECIPPKVEFTADDGTTKCENYLTMSAKDSALAAEQLRKEKYFRYAWSRHQQEPGHPHHFRIVPRRFPHADGADLGTLRVFSQAL